MNKKLFNVLLFAGGAAVGSLVTWKVVKTKYERIAQEEIESVKETWARRARVESDEEVPCEEEDFEDECDDLEGDFEDSDKIAYYRLASKYNKSGEEAENGGEGAGDGDVPYINGPYVISPEEFGDGNYDHSPCGVTYYADGVLADTWDVELDIDETIGEEALKHFGEYAEDVVHVRNERLLIDYEVVRDPRNYADVRASVSPDACV